MNRDAFNKFYWGFLFIMIDFRIGGFDILPDIAGYILFGIGLSALVSTSIYFKKASKLNLPMIILSIFSIYQRQNQNQVSGIHIDSASMFYFLGAAAAIVIAIIIAIVVIVIQLMLIYNIFMGIKDLAEQQRQIELAVEADQRWKQYLILQIASMATFILIIIPPLALIYIIGLFVAAIVMTVIIMGYMKRCGEVL